MRMDIPAFGLAVGVIWAAAIFVVAVANLVVPGYGRAFLDFAASIYPGFHPGTGAGSVVSGTLWGLVDGFVGGALFAWLYNLIARRRPETA